MLATRAHMLAMYVVLENYLQMLCDYPAAYEGEAGYSFLYTVLTSWDETRVLSATHNEQVTMARRKQDRWYTGAITNNKSKYHPSFLWYFSRRKLYRRNLFGCCRCYTVHQPPET